MSGLEDSQHKQTGIDERLAFAGLDEAAKKRLQGLKHVLEGAMSDALAAFEEKARNTPLSSDLFTKEDDLTAAKSELKQHWAALAGSNFSESYVKEAYNLGRNHARCGLAPQWHVGEYAIVIGPLILAVVKAARPGFLSKAKRQSDGMAADLISLVRAAFLDMDLSMSAYLDEIENKFKEAEAARQAAEDNQTHAIAVFSAALETLATGNLRNRIEATLEPAFDALKRDFNETVGSLQEAFQTSVKCGPAVQQVTDEVIAGAGNIFHRTREQAASLEQTAAALAEITSTIAETVKSTGHAQDVVSVTKSNAEQGGQVVVMAIEAMGQIEKSSKQIGQISNVIDEIAFQTNLLALNAGVEAARAGHSGRGFAVVASEVRNLAQRSAQAAKEITSLITAATREVEEGVMLVGETGKAFEEIVVKVGEVTNVVAGISAAAKGQALALDQVTNAVTHMDQLTQRNAEMAGETAMALDSLKQQAGELIEACSNFDAGEPRVETFAKNWGQAAA